PHHGNGEEQHDPEQSPELADMVAVSCMATVSFVTGVVLAFVPVTLVLGVVLVHVVMGLWWVLGTHAWFSFMVLVVRKCRRRIIRDTWGSQWWGGGFRNSFDTAGHALRVA